MFELVLFFLAIFGAYVILREAVEGFANFILK